MKQPKAFAINGAITIAFLAAAGIWYQHLLTGGPVRSEDLPGHVALIKQLRAQLSAGRVFFYDTTWFTGWPAFQFYGFLSHLTLALISLPLGLLLDAPVEAAVHGSIVLGLGLLPLSLYYAAGSFLAASLDHQPPVYARTRPLLLLTCCALTVWWFGHDEQFYGVGAGAVLHVGLLPQLFGWHGVLLYFGALLRTVRDPERGCCALLCVMLACLILTHPLSALFAAAVGAVVIIWRRKRRMLLLGLHAGAVGLASFWLVPFFWLSKEYMLPDVYPPRGDLLQFFFRYPLQLLFAGVLKEGPAFLGRISLFYPLFGLLTLLMLLHPEPRRCRPLINAFFLLLALALLLNSSYIAASLPLGIHYYRFQGLLVLLLLAVFAAIPALTSIRRDAKQRSVESRPMLEAAWVLVLAAAVVSSARLPTLESQAAAKQGGKNDLAPYVNVLRYLKDHPVQGRVYVEHLNNYRLLPYLGCHYLLSNLPGEAGREVINGLFIESSLAYRMPAASAALLGAETYTSYLVFTKNSDLDDAAAVEQLRSFGVSHIVGSSRRFLRRLKPFAAAAPKHFGPVWVAEIAERTPPKAQPAAKTLIGYFDPGSRLPFTYLEFYFYARKELYRRYSLIALDDLAKRPPGLSAVLAVASRDAAPAVEVPVLLLDPPTQKFLHYNRSYPPITTIPRYQRLEAYLDGHADLAGRLAEAAPAAPAEQDTFPAIESEWNPLRQELRLAQVPPDKTVRIDYSYFPLFTADSGQLYRGSGERLYFHSDRSEAVLRYTPWSHPSVPLGWAITMLSLAASVLTIRRAGAA